MISIIMPTYNRGYIIEKAINSIKKQTYQNYELIIVDDGSNDDTYEKIKDIWDDHIKYYDLKTNKGANYARNYGIMKSKGEILAFLDTDNEWDSIFLERRIQTLENEKADLVFGRVKRLDKNKVFFWPNNSKDELSDKENIIKIMFFGNVIDTNSVLLRKECWKAVHGFDEKLKRFQDWDFFFRIIWKQNSRVVFSDDVLVKSKIQDNSISNKTELYWTARLYILKKYISLCRKKGYLYDVVYYLINPSDEYTINTDIELEILSLLDKKDFLGIFPRLKKMDRVIQDMNSTLLELTQTSQKNHMIMTLQQQWIKQMKKGWSIEEELIKYKFTRVMIYGYGILGQSLYCTLEESVIKVVYVIDKDMSKLQGEVAEEKILKDLTQLRCIEKVDAIIVTPVLEFGTIREQLKQYIEIPILSISSLIEGKEGYRESQ